MGGGEHRREGGHNTHAPNVNSPLLSLVKQLYQFLPPPNNNFFSEYVIVIAWSQGFMAVFM